MNDAPRVYSCRSGAPRIPEGAVLVDRRTKWGNPFRLEDERDRTAILVQYEEWIKTQPQLIAEAKAELRGKDLVCWCAPKACHADVLLRIANEAA